MFASLSTAIRTFLSKFRQSNGTEDSSSEAPRSRVGKIVKTQPFHITQILSDGLRDQDLAELEALGREPKQALYEGFEASQPHCYTILVGNRAAAMFGVAPTETEGTGIVWMLGTDTLLQSKRELVVEARRWLIYLNSLYPILVNAVDERNSISINWLEVMGFSFGPSISLANGVVFRSFSRCAQSQELFKGLK